MTPEILKEIQNQIASLPKKVRDAISSTDTTSEIANLREGAVDSVDSIKEIPAPVVIVEPAVEKIENAVVFQEEVVANEDIDAFVKKEPATLEEKILEYINNNPEGIRVSDMEQPLHETRMKIGYASKCLLDAGKVIKIDNLYYPINK